MYMHFFRVLGGFQAMPIVVLWELVYSLTSFCRCNQPFHFLEFSLCIMADDAKASVQGKVYAAFLLSQADYAAKPLMAGMVKLDPSEGMTYKRMETAAELNGVFFWTTKIVLEDQLLPMDAVKTAFKLWVDDRRSRFERKSKTTLKDVTCIESGIVSGITFIERAVSIAILSPETVERCWLLKSPSVAKRLPTGALPSLPDGDSPLAQATPQQNKEATAAKPLLPGGENEVQTEGSQRVDDPFALAVDQIGLDYGAEVTIIGEVETEQPGEEDGEPALDLDREVEDALEQASTLSAVDKSSPAVSSLIATVRRLQGVHRKQESMIRSLNQLTAAQEVRLQSYQANSAEDIAAGLSPALKNSLCEIKKEMMKEVKIEVDEVKKLVREEGKDVLTQELAGIKSSISILTTKVSEVLKLGQSTMGAAALANDNLKASGIVMKEDPLSQVDIPEVLLQINSKLNGLDNAMPDKGGLALNNRPQPSNFSSSALDNDKTPCPQQAMSSATPTPADTPSKTPRKASRFRGFMDPYHRADQKPTARDIASQFGGSPATPAASGLMEDMLKAKSTWALPQQKPQPQLTQAQIHEKLRQMGAASVSQKRLRKN